MSSNDEIVCYTNDGLIVFTLYVKNIIPEKAKDVKDYFLTFGEITSVIFSETVGNYSAFVTFKNAGDAARALRQPNHWCFSKEIQVEWADMWHQPEAAFEFNLNLLDLNDDCLLQIIPYLDSLEKVRFSLTCQRFRALYETLLQFGEICNYIDATLKDDVPETIEFLSRSGQHIKRIICGFPIDIRFIELLPTYCNNLEEIEFRSMYDMHFGHYSRIFRANGNLKKVNLIDCSYDYLSDAVFEEISRLTQLTSLNLMETFRFTGKHLDKMKSLIDLTLQTTHISTESFVDLCKEVQLKTLNITGCDQLTTEAYQALVDTQTQLERISVSECERSGTGSELVAQIKNLKHIKIWLSDDKNLLAELILHKRDSLESLSITAYKMSQITKDRILKFRKLQKLSLRNASYPPNKYVDDQFILKIAQNCTELREFICPGPSALKESVLIDLMKFGVNLEKVNVSKWNLSKGVYDKLVTVLKGRKVKPMRPVELNVHEARIHNGILRTEKYRMNRNLLKLSFVDDFPYNWGTTGT